MEKKDPGGQLEERDTKAEEPELPFEMRQPQAEFYFSEFLQVSTHRAWRCAGHILTDFSC
jgi:hypothetical protein